MPTTTLKVFMALLFDDIVHPNNFVAIQLGIGISNHLINHVTFVNLQVLPINKVKTQTFEFQSKIPFIVRYTKAGQKPRSLSHLLAHAIRPTNSLNFIFICSKM